MSNIHSPSGLRGIDDEFNGPIPRRRKPAPVPTTVCYTQVLDHPDQSLTVEWVRDADWDQHWAVFFNGASGCRQQVNRFGSYREARARIDRHLTSLKERGA